MTDHDEGKTMTAVINEEGQYALWPARRPCPPGWKATGFVGSTAECRSYVERVWTDMRPLSLQRADGA
jgi:MbtH protein